MTLADKLISFLDPRDEKTLIAVMNEYGDSMDAFHGIDDDGKHVLVSVFRDRIIVYSLQDDGQMQEKIFHRDGSREVLFEKS